MFIAIDVHYRTTFAKAVSIEFSGWEAAAPSAIHIVEVNDIAEYIPGEFYKRELPCILKVLKKSNLDEVEAIIVDGYVVLDDERKPGLGMYLYNALDGKVPVIGVAKNSFRSNTKHVEEVYRGESKKPLYITSVGYDLKKAAGNVRQMHGDFRFPELLSVLDQHTKMD